MGRIMVLMISFLIAILIGASYVSANVTPANMAPALEKVMKDVQHIFNDIDKELSAAAKELSAVDLKSTDAEKSLRRLCESAPYIIDCAVLDVTGKMILVEPGKYKKHEGVNIEAQPDIKKLIITKKPVMSGVFKSVEGESVVSINYPIISKDGALFGAVSMIVRQDILLSDVVTKLAKNDSWKVWVMQTDGLVLYDQDRNQINRNVFSDEMYAPFENLISFCRRVSRENAGIGSYDFYLKGYENKALVKKDAVWDTVSLYSTDWRVVVAEVGQN